MSYDIICLELSPNRYTLRILGDHNDIFCNHNDLLCDWTRLICLCFMHFMSRFLSYYVSCLHNMLFKYIICYFYFSLPPFNPLVLRVHTQVHSSRRGQSTESGSDNTHLWLTQASCLSSLQKTNTITSASFLRLRQVVGVRVHITQQCLTS
jgi:hypothetical protein